MSIRYSRKNQWVQIFFEYTRRYAEIIEDFPETINELSFDFGQLEGGLRDKTMRTMRRYFDMCSEQYWLQKERYIPQKIWKEWKDGMKTAFNKTAFRTAWAKISKDQRYPGSFIQFVEELTRRN